MRRIFTLLILCALATVVNAQSTKWFKGTLDQAIQKAKIEDKAVYLQIAFNN